MEYTCVIKATSKARWVPPSWRIEAKPSLLERAIKRLEKDEGVEVTGVYDSNGEKVR